MSEHIPVCRASSPGWSFTSRVFDALALLSPGHLPVFLAMEKKLFLRWSPAQVGALFLSPCAGEGKGDEHSEQLMGRSVTLLLWGFPVVKPQYSGGENAFAPVVLDGGAVFPNLQTKI